MGKNNSLYELLGSDRGKYVPGVTISCVVFCFESGSLKLLLCKPKSLEEWILPGGPIAQDEGADEAVRRTLKEKIGVKRSYLKQFHFFCNRDHTEVAGDCTSAARSINLAYYSFVKADEIKFSRTDAEDLKWFAFPVCESSSIHKDHQKIIDTCISSIRRQIGFLPIGYKLLSEKFTMPELRTIYETILNRSIDRRNFQRKMLSIGCVKPLEEKRSIGGHKSPNLYRFEKKVYDEAEKQGLQLMTNNL